MHNSNTERTLKLYASAGGNLIKAIERVSVVYDVGRADVDRDDCDVKPSRLKLHHRYHKEDISLIIIHTYRII
jgi:hypothetical protein